MALSKSIKMYLTLFVATTCVYMLLYQYHISREAMPPPELIKSKQSEESLSSRVSAASLVKRYNLFLWSPLSLMTTSQSSPSFSSIVETSIKRTTTPTTTTTTTSARGTPTSANSMSSTIITPFSSSSLSSLPLTSSPSSLSPSTSSASPVKAPASAVARNRTLQQNSGDSLLLLPLRLDSNKATATTTSKIISTATATATAATDTFNKIIGSKDNSKINTNKTKPMTTPTTTTNTKKTPASTKPPPLYIITPTYRRPEQLAELTRLGYTLKHVANLLWLVIEDANTTAPLVTATLDRIGVPYEYLVAPMPEKYKKTKKAKPRGVSNRNRGLQWLRANATEGVFYFADDDNTYDIAIFEQMRYTKKVSMWPVGLVTKFGVSSPIIRKGALVSFYDGWIGGRKYPVDMAGFAVSVAFLLDRPKAEMPYKPGYEEDGFLKSLAPLNNTEIELLASNCTEILTWHTQTKKNGVAQPLNMTKYGDTNLVAIDKNLVRT